jgi:endo-1,4-beta-xylanase
VSSLKARGIKIDGVGLQGHFIVGSTPSLATLTATLKAFTNLAVEVAYTELDVRFTSLPPTAAGLTQQSTDYVNVVNSCLGNTGCVGITIWDFTDKYSWIPSTFSGQGQACLWYDDYTKHPAYYAVVSALGGTATATSTVASSTSTSTKASTTLVTSTTKASTSTTTAATSTSTALAAQWAQCGGYPGVWLGPTACVSPYVCTYQNAWYSQCL